MMIANGVAVFMGTLSFLCCGDWRAADAKELEEDPGALRSWAEAGVGARGLRREYGAG
jgi:hypothetical protein